MDLTSNKRVKGFLRAKGQKIVNGNGEEIILTGWGLGNWLLPEGYMWKASTANFDRPLTIEATIRTLTGSKYAEYFWEKFRELYITENDIKKMAELGYNSVRIPINWRLLMEDEPGIHFIEKGFKLLDDCINWCEKYSIYVFLDLHGAPGGQTGANIDDSIDNIPRLFIDADSWDKAIALWKEIATRYKDRFIIGGYDLLNEPIRPKNEYGDFDYLVPKLIQFYEEAIAAIRKVDKNHIFSIEGHHWATRKEIFDRIYDDNMVIHFHRYACLPDISSFTEWLELSEKLDLPLWLGETGENLNEWYTAIYPLAVSLGIGYNLWPWKKMHCTNSPYSINLPKDWELILNYINGGVRPSYDKAREIFNEFLHNIKLENCQENLDVTNSVFRKPSCSVRATDFDELPGNNVSYFGKQTINNDYNYRKGTSMNIVEDTSYVPKKRFYFDCLWDRFILNLKTDEFASYTINELEEHNYVSFEYSCEAETTISIYQNEILLKTIKLSPSIDKQIVKDIPLEKASKAVVKLLVNEGDINLIRILFK